MQGYSSHRGLLREQCSQPHLPDVSSPALPLPSSFPPGAAPPTEPHPCPLWASTPAPPPPAARPHAPTRGPGGGCEPSSLQEAKSNSNNNGLETLKAIEGNAQVAGPAWRPLVMRASAQASARYSRMKPWPWVLQAVKRVQRSLYTNKEHDIMKQVQPYPQRTPYSVRLQLAP